MDCERYHDPLTYSCTRTCLGVVYHKAHHGTWTTIMIRVRDFDNNVEIHLITSLEPDTFMGWVLMRVSGEFREEDPV